MDITGVDGRTLEALSAHLVLFKGDDKVTVGLSWMQTFAVYVASKYLHEGSGESRAVSVLKFLANVSLAQMEAAGQRGETFTAWSVQGCSPTFIKPPDTAMGRRLDLRQLYGEFQAGMKRVFPNG